MTFINNLLSFHHDGRLVDHHVHVNRTKYIPSVKNIIPNGYVNITTSLFFFFEVTIALANRVQPYANFGDVICVFNRLYDVA